MWRRCIYSMFFLPLLICRALWHVAQHGNAGHMRVETYREARGGSEPVAGCLRQERLKFGSPGDRSDQRFSQRGFVSGPVYKFVRLPRVPPTRSLSSRLRGYQPAQPAAVEICCLIPRAPAQSSNKPRPPLARRCDRPEFISPRARVFPRFSSPIPPSSTTARPSSSSQTSALSPLEASVSTWLRTAKVPPRMISSATQYPFATATSNLNAPVKPTHTPILLITLPPLPTRNLTSLTVSFLPHPTHPTSAPPR